MGVSVLQVYPVKEGLTGVQTIDMLINRVQNLGGVQNGHFLVDCDSYVCLQPVIGGIQGQPGPPRTLNVLHNSDYPVTTFALLEVPVASLQAQGGGPVPPSYKTVSLVADSVFDLLVPKLQPTYTPKKIRIESKGPRFDVGDFVVKLGSVLMAQSFKGILLEIEYRPCVMVENCWELLMEFVQGILGQNAQTTIPRTLQPQNRKQEVYAPLDTMNQYMDQFTAFRKAAGIR